MMAESAPLRKRPKKPFKGKGALAQRILLVALFLLVIPLTIHTFFLWDKEWKAQLKDHFSKTSLMAKAEQQLAHQWIALQENRLKIFSLFLEENQWQKAKAISGYDALFFTESGKTGVFAGYDPKTKKPMIFVAIPAGRHGGVLGLGVDAKKWLMALSSFEKQLSPFSLSIEWKGQLFASTNPDIKLDKRQIYEVGEASKWVKTQNIGKKPTFFGVKVPLEQADFSLVVSTSSAMASKTSPLVGRLIDFILIVLVVGGLGTLWLAYRISRPLNQIHEVMDELASGNLAARFHPDLMGFEINALGNHLNQMVGDLGHHMEEAKREKTQKQLLEKELKIGHEIQKSLLPQWGNQFGPLSIAGLSVPAKEVSGDFYDLFSLDEDRLFLAIADGSDKGISACLYSLVVRSMLRSHFQSEETLEEIAVKTNNLFCADTGVSGNFVTAWIGIYEEGVLNYCSMGHLPALYLSGDGEITELQTKGRAFGAGALEHVEIAKLEIKSGDLLFFYTDGITEARNADGELFGLDRLKAFLFDKKNRSPQEIMRDLQEQIERFSPETTRLDDLTALAISHNESSRSASRKI